MKTFAIAVLTTWVIAAILYFLEVPKWAGAHPIWASQTLLTGVLLGSVLAALTRKLKHPIVVIGFAFLSVASFLIASYGKGRFAASFAEDTFGGQLWFFGWHAVCAFGAAATAAGLYRILAARIG